MPDRMLRIRLTDGTAIKLGKINRSVDDDGPTFEGLSSGEARKQEGRQHVHCVHEYFTEVCFRSSYFN